MTPLRLPLPCRWAALCVATFALPAAASDAGGAAPGGVQPVHTLSADGTLVIDTRARLAWPRCVEGMRWTGSTCVGQPQLMTYSEAQARAKERWKADGVRWRLPRVNELRRLVHRNAKPPAVDGQLFPAAPAEWHWSGTAAVNTGGVNRYDYSNVARGGEGESQLTVQQGWAVDMSSGQGRGNVGRATRLVVRLVRPAP